MIEHGSNYAILPAGAVIARVLRITLSTVYIARLYHEALAGVHVKVHASWAFTLSSIDYTDRS